VVHNRALTWDNLKKRGFIEPSLCVLCYQEEETKEHIFNGCHYNQQIWDQGAQIMHKSNQHRSSMNATIENWDHITYTNPLLNQIWQLLSGFILWKIWKEQNKRIFHSQASTPKATWEKISSLIKETIRRKSWKEEDLNYNSREQ
jgi:transposase